MTKLEIILLILDIITIILLILELNKKIEKPRKINNNNKILFYKLQKQYLNNCTTDDISDLIVFLNNYYLERRNKKCK